MKGKQVIIMDCLALCQFLGIMIKREAGKIPENWHNSKQSISYLA